MKMRLLADALEKFLHLQKMMKLLEVSVKFHKIDTGQHVQFPVFRMELVQAYRNSN